MQAGACVQQARLSYAIRYPLVVGLRSWHGGIMGKIRGVSWGLVAFCFVCTGPTFGQRCGVERWSVKTGTDSDSSHVDLSNSQPANIKDLVALQPPNPLPKDSRFTPTETTVFVVNATLTDYKLEAGATGDSDYHLVLMDEQGTTMVAEIPSPSCVGPGSPFASQISTARAQFDAQFSATSSFQTANVPVRVTGVGFFDFFHHQHGAAPNVIELHPILDIQINPGPTNGDFVLSGSSAVMHLHGGSSSSVTLTASPMGGDSSSNIDFNVAGLPSGVTSKVVPVGVGKVNLILTAPASVPGGTFPIVVTASGKGRSHSLTIALNTSNAPETEESPQWEYKMITAATEQDVVDQANLLGAQEWELVSVTRVSGPSAWRAFFKRLKKD